MASFTQRMKMHLNGGSKFSTLIYDVLIDGKPTGIQRSKHTNGSPKYFITQDLFVAEDGSEFDMLAAKGQGITEWLEAHTK